MRILVTGSRDWSDRDWIALVLDLATPNTQHTLVSGACSTGADALAEQIAYEKGWIVERHPADWKKFGKSAGFRRNAEMVNLGADVCVAFIRNNSRGASHTAHLAEKAGIPTLRYRETG